MRIRSEKCLAGHTILLKMHLMTDTITGARVVDAEACRDTLQVLVVVGVLNPACSML